MLKRLLIIGSAVLIFGLGVLVTRYFYTARLKTNSDEQSTVLLEKIKKVSKLVTVEGYFSEIYDYKDYYGYDWSPFRKKALMRVKAKVLVGYDLSGIKIEADQARKTILISGLPDPEIMSVDHDIDYYDLQEGTFNSFSTEDYNRLNANAKKYIEQKAQESDLFLAAEEQGNQLLDMIKFMVESAGWTLEYQPRGGLSPTKTESN